MHITGDYLLIDNTQNRFHEAVVNLSRAYVETNVRLGPNNHASADATEIMKVEETVLEDAGVRAEIAKLKLPEGSVVVVDPWIYGRFASVRLTVSSLNRRHAQVPTASRMTIECGNASCTCATPGTLPKQTHAITLSPFPSRRSSAQRPGRFCG